MKGWKAANVVYVVVHKLNICFFMGLSTRPHTIPKVTSGIAYTETNNVRLWYVKMHYALVLTVHWSS